MARKNPDIIHIYAGTSGSAGLYLHEIYSALKKKYNQEVFVNNYYSFDYGRKVFYKYSELSSPYDFIKKKILIRSVIRFIELFFALTHILIFLIRNSNVRLVNYSLTSDLRIEYYFLLIVKKVLGRKVVITCHDVIPFGIDLTDIERRKKTKKMFFDLANILIVHNNNSNSDLQNQFNIEKNKIFEFPFPVMDLNLLPAYNGQVDSIFKKDKNTFRVGMVGHFRKEKGLEILLSAWDKFYDSGKKSELFLAGKFPGNLDLDYSSFSKKNIRVINNYIDDLMYISIIRNCDLIVLPYTKGTNSGIPSSVMSLKTLLLTSDIEMFRNNSLINDVFIFPNKNSTILFEKMKWVSELSQNERNVLISGNSLSFEQYRVDFKVSAQNCFENIFMEDKSKN
jgi:glycosyltransferase involved in cell wall biosynthesis